MVQTKKTETNKYSLREPSFYNVWRRIFLYLVTSIGYMVRFKLVYPPLMAGIMPRGVAYMAKKELFNNLFLRWWLDWLGAFAVDREKLGVSTIKTVKSLKSTGWVLGIFPQGTRQEPGVISNVTKGFASLAKSTKCGILPIGITGTQEVHRWPFTGKIVVNIGEVIPCSDNVEKMVDDWGHSIEKLTGFTYSHKD